MSALALAACASGFSIKAPEIYPIRAPAAGNYPQGLYKYPFRGKALTTELPYTQTLAWLPEVGKTFAADTQYTAVLTLEPKRGFGAVFRENNRYGVSGLPEAGVESVSTEVVDGNLVIRIVFEKTAAENEEAQILFEDDFPGDSLDSAKWESPEGDRQERSTWDKSMVSVGGGHLRIKIKRDAALGRSRSRDPVTANNWIRTGAAQTRRAQPPYAGPILFENTYGYYEARIQFPRLDGTWGAFWLMTTTMELIPGTGVIGTEIDIVESIGSASNRYNSALHWDGYGENHKSVGSDINRPVNIYDGEFHVFALDWSPSEYVFYVDGLEFWRVDGGEKFNNVGINQNPNYIIFSVEAAAWAGSLPADFEEAEMLVDYVRVWNQPRNH
uniref:Laminarinase n=1 Tax=uncultured bacterium contig00033 TaxID=1181522 RepID=A0A806K0X1_9BACT|nr:laminarinase [uncultured bacterium contig00033]